MGKRGITLVIVILSGALLLSMIPDNSSAFPYRVKGYLKTEDGTPIPHGTIRISGSVFNISSGQVEMSSSSFTDATSSTGYFDISFGVDEPGGLSTGDSITISYSDEDRDVSHQFVLTGVGSWVNLTAEDRSTLTDNLFSPVGIAVIVIVLFVMIVAGYWYSSREKEEELKSEEAKTKVGRRRR